MQTRTVGWSLFTLAAIALAAIQFVPGPPLQVPAQLPAAERPAHRQLNFEGVGNFRDLGGYPAADGRRVRWGALYRSASLDDASRADQQGLRELHLYALVDFRSAQEKQDGPDQLPRDPGFRVVELPVLDAGGNSIGEHVSQAMDSGDFGSFDPDAVMRDAYRQFTWRYNDQFAAFFDLLLQAAGEPVAWHCTAGKDRTGYAAAVLLRLLGVPDEIIMRDYMASGDQALVARSSSLLLARLTRGEEAADKIAVLLGVRENWLRAAFDAIDERYGSFENYLDTGLGLDSAEQARLRALLLD